MPNVSETAWSDRFPTTIGELGDCTDTIAKPAAPSATAIRSPLTARANTDGGVAPEGFTVARSTGASGFETSTRRSPPDPSAMARCGASANSKAPTSNAYPGVPIVPTTAGASGSLTSTMRTPREPHAT